MKGLLLKDYFAIKSSMIILLIGFVVFGFGVSFYAPPYVLMLIASIILGQFVTTTIYSDRKCGWLKSSITFPTSKKSHVSSKYIMYALLCLLGVVVGLVLSIIITSIRNELDTHYVRGCSYSLLLFYQRRIKRSYWNFSIRNIGCIFLWHD